MKESLFYYYRLGLLYYIILYYAWPLLRYFAINFIVGNENQKFFYFYFFI